MGGDAPISVQTMTNTLTTDVQATIRQVNDCAEAGADIVRISVPDVESSEALKQIIPHVDVPIVADIHFHYRRGIEAAEAGAACLRINPGNIGDEKRVKEVIKAARDHDCSIRIGVNAGSLEKHLLEKYGEPCPDAMVESGLDHIKIPAGQRLPRVQDLGARPPMCSSPRRPISSSPRPRDAPIHLGITEAGGTGRAGRSNPPSGSAICSGWGSATRSVSRFPPIRWKR